MSSNGTDLKAAFKEYFDRLKNYSPLERYPIRRAQDVPDYIDWHFGLGLDVCQASVRSTRFAMLAILYTMKVGGKSADSFWDPIHTNC